MKISYCIVHRFKCLEIETAHATLDAMFEFMYIYTVRRKRVYTGSASGINCLHGADRICNVGGESDVVRGDMEKVVYY